MICGFADYRFGFVSEVGSLTPVKGHRASCLVVSKKKKKRCEIPSVLISWSSAGSQGAGLCPSRHRRQHRVWRRANTSNKWSSMQTVKTSLIWWTLKLTCTNEAFAPSYKTICSLSTKLAAWPSESMPVDTHTVGQQPHSGAPSAAARCSMVILPHSRAHRVPFITVCRSVQTVTLVTLVWNNEVRRYVQVIPMSSSPGFRLDKGSILHTDSL